MLEPKKRPPVALLEVSRPEIRDKVPPQAIDIVGRPDDVPDIRALGRIAARYAASIRTCRIRGGVPLDSLDWLAPCKRLNRLVVDSEFVSSIEAVRGFSNLREFATSVERKKRGFSLAPLAGTRLGWLLTDLVDDDLPIVESMSAVHKLDFHHVSAETLRVRLPASVEEFSIEDSNCRRIEAEKTLSLLRIWSCKALDDVGSLRAAFVAINVASPAVTRCLPKMGEMKKLELRAVPLAGDFSWLLHCESLEKLSIEKCGPLTNWHILLSHPNLRTLLIDCSDREIAKSAGAGKRVSNGNKTIES